MIRRCPHWLLFLFLAVVVLAACRPAGQAPAAKPVGLVRQFGSGGVGLELRLDRQTLTVAERLTVELRAESDEEHSVRFSEWPKSPGFTVASSQTGEPALVGPGRVAVTARYTLEPVGPGSWQLPALIVEAWQKGKEQADLVKIATEPVPIEVTSLLAKDDTGEQISDIAPPLAQPINPWLWVGGGATALAILLGLIWWWRRRKQRASLPPPPLPPHLLAYQALKALLATDLLASGQYKPFYAALSDILRHYIEQRFGLRAPERTTEEFLVELGQVTSGPMAAVGHRLLLRDFLSRCDLVKFANATPDRFETEAAVELCRRFVRETEPVPVDTTVGGAA